MIVILPNCSICIYTEICNKKEKHFIRHYLTLKKLQTHLPKAVLEDTEIFASYGYKIGETGPGNGIIFYVADKNIYPDGFPMSDGGLNCFYLEAAPVDIPEKLSLSPTGILFINLFMSSGSKTTDAEIGAGKNNTLNILQYDENSPAANACINYNEGDLSDWFIPSAEELYELYKLYELKGKNNFGNLSPDFYITSTYGVGKNNTSITLVNFENDFGPLSANGSTEEWLVRPIRAF